MRIAITGGASGLGRETVLHCLQRGDRVAVGDIDAAALQALQADRPMVAVRCSDFAQAGTGEAFVGWAAETLGGIDALINNVGISGPHALLEDLPLADIERLLQVNLATAMACIRAALPLMKAAGLGAIVNVTTASTRTLPAARSAYIVSKAATEALTRAVAREAGPFGVRCNAILPGPMRSERLMKVLAERAGSTCTPAELEAEVAQTVALRQLVDMRDVAEIIRFFCSGPGLAVTGQLLAVDGDAFYEA